MLRAIIGTRSSITSGCRFLSANTGPPAVSRPYKKAFDQLREITKHRFSRRECRVALAKFDFTQLKQAAKWLKDMERAKYDALTREGWKMTEKMRSSLKSGLVGMKIDGDLAAVVELSCETESTTNGEPFQQLLASLTNAVIAHMKRMKEPASKRMQTRTLNKYVFHVISVESGRPVDEVLAETSIRLGEHLRVRMVTMYWAPKGVPFYGAAQPNNTVSGVSMGHCVSLLAMKRIGPEGTTLPSTSLADQICQHVIGMKSEGLGEQPLPRIANKAVEETANGEENELNDSSGQTGETTLLRQTFLLNSSQTVHDYLQGHNAKVVDFARVEIIKS